LGVISCGGDDNPNNGGGNNNNSGDNNNSGNNTAVVDPSTVVKSTFTDGRDGKEYKTVRIGSQTWMAENLNYQTDSSWCYDDADSNCVKYGRLYDWETATTVCPNEWVLPDSADWELLLAAAGGNEATGRLRARSGWGNKDNGTDDYGFSALPGGLRTYNGIFTNADCKDNCYGCCTGTWWTATAISVTAAYSHSGGMTNKTHGKMYGFSVRCVKNHYHWDGTGIDPSTVVKGAFTDDRDGQTYKTVKIGGQTWMAENLNKETENSWCYENSPDSCAKYGRLYDWNAAKTACPRGWHLPDNETWNRLVKTVGSYPTIKLKSTENWKRDSYGNSGNGKDSYGFSALPGGQRNSIGGFLSVSWYGTWWTSTIQQDGRAYDRTIYSDHDAVTSSIMDKIFGYSVRCVQD